MKVIYSQPVATGQLTFQLPRGQYRFIAIEYDLDAATGVTLTRANMGNIRMTYDGDDIINIDAEMLNLINNLYGGVAEFSAAAGAATRMTCFIPVGQFWDSENVLDVGNQNQCQIQLTYPNLALPANVDSGTVRIHVIEQVGTMRYFFMLNQFFEQVSAASVKQNSLPINNVAQLFFKDPAGSNVTYMQILKDQDTIVNDSTSILLAENAWLHQLETATAYMAVEFNTSKDLREIIGRQISYQYTFSGAGTLSQYYSAIKFASQAKVSESMKMAENKITKNLNTVM